MSAEEESFIILDETPSMLAYSILGDNSVLSSTDNVSHTINAMTNLSMLSDESLFQQPSDTVAKSSVAPNSLWFKTKTTTAEASPSSSPPISIATASYSTAISPISAAHLYNYNGSIESPKVSMDNGATNSIAWPNNDSENSMSSNSLSLKMPQSKQVHESDSFVDVGKNSSGTANLLWATTSSTSPFSAVPANAASLSSSPLFANGNVNESIESPRTSINNTLQQKPTEVLNEKNNQSSVYSVEKSTSNLAESFLLGAIDCNTMKYNVMSNFPSLYTSSTRSEDIEKLQSLIQEHNELKENLQRSNVAMRKQFSMVNSWHSNVKMLKESHENELNKFKNINDELFNQNKELQQKIEELHVWVDLNCKQSQLVVNDEQEKADEAARIEKEKYESQIRDLQMELSKAIGENVEFEDMRKVYIDEIDCLKVNLVATEELYKNATAEMLVLKSQNLTLKQQLTQTEVQLKECQDEVGAMRAQCDQYKKDFEQERSARQDIAGEKDQLVADLQLLQKRNQALVEETQSHLSEASITSFISTTSADTDDSDQPNRKYICPICSVEYDDLDRLERHVYDCLEKMQ